MPKRKKARTLGGQFYVDAPTIAIRPRGRLPLPIHLLVEWYEDVSPERQTELRTCLGRNRAAGVFSAIHIFGTEEHLNRLPADRSVRNPRAERMTYRSFLEYASARLRGAVCVIANTDIYFDGSVRKLGMLALEGFFLALARWDITRTGHAVFCNRSDSADAWAFIPPIDFGPAAEILLGKPGCDNRIARVAHDAGHKVVNPSHDIRAYHLHLSRVRRYSDIDRIPGPYLRVPPTNLRGDLQYYEKPFQLDTASPASPASPAPPTRSRVPRKRVRRRPINKRPRTAILPGRALSAIQRRSTR